MVLYGHDARMPGESQPIEWELRAAPDDYDGDLWAAGADLAPGTLLAAYRLALFPMPVRGTIGWFSPAQRAVFPLEAFAAPSRSLRRARRRYEIRVDGAFEAVVAGCARPGDPESWIDGPITDAYVRLHDLGWAHSVEAWDDDGLAGGLYGVSIGGLFAAESMFHARTDASKAALVGLVELLTAAGNPDVRVLDAQWLTPHLETLGAVEITRAEYRVRLERALELDAAL